MLLLVDPVYITLCFLRDGRIIWMCDSCFVLSPFRNWPTVSKLHTLVLLYNTTIYYTTRYLLPFPLYRPAETLRGN